MAKRGSIFEQDDELDISGFAPKTALAPQTPRDELQAIAEASRFPSREAKPAAETRPAPLTVKAQEAEPAPVAAEAQPTKRPPRRHRTGRTMQLNTRTTPATVEAFYAIADRQGWLMGETVERALAALQRELGEAK